MKNKSDFFFLIILIVVVSAFIGLNIIKIIDLSMKQISINVPPVKIPPAKIEISLNKEAKRLLLSCNQKTKKKRNKLIKKIFNIKKNKK